MKEKIMFGIVDPEGKIRITAGYCFYGRESDEHTRQMAEQNWIHFKEEVPKQYPGSTAFRTTATELVSNLSDYLPLEEIYFEDQEED